MDIKTNEYYYLKRQLEILELEKKEVVISIKILELKNRIAELGKKHSSDLRTSFKTHAVPVVPENGGHRVHSSPPPCSTNSKSESHYHDYDITTNQRASFATHPRVHQQSDCGLDEGHCDKARKISQQTPGIPPVDQLTVNSPDLCNGLVDPCQFGTCCDALVDEQGRTSRRRKRHRKTTTTTGRSLSHSSKRSRSSSGEDKLERISIPIFSGDKSKFHTWLTAFSIVDECSDSGKIKMLRLIKCVDKNIGNVLHDFGYSNKGYQAAMDYLIDNYGGYRRLIQKRMRDLRNFSPIHDGEYREVKSLSHLVEATILNIHDSGREEDLSDNMLYSIILSKLPCNMLVRYHEWRDNTDSKESVRTVSKWLKNQAKYMMRAEEDGESEEIDYYNHRHHGHSFNTTRLRQKPWTQFSRKCKVCKIVGAHTVIRVSNR